MATPQQREAKIAQIKKAISAILKSNPNEFTRTEELGKKHDFTDALEPMLGIQRLVQVLDTLDLRRLPIPRLDRFIERLSPIQNSLEAIRVSTNPGERDTLIANLETNFNSAIDALAPVLFLSFDDTVLAGLQGQAKSKLDEVNKLLESQQNQVGAVAELLNKAKELATGAAIVEYAKIFMDESESASKSAGKWFWGTLGAIVFTITVGIILFFSFTPAVPVATEMSTSVLVLRGLSKFVLLSFLVGVVVWCSRVYRAYLHNSIVNKHRANALNVFDAFSRAAGGDLQTKHAVLLQATSAIFSPQNSGFIPDEKDLSTSPQIIEIFKSMADSK
jgi:hypothetical protein